MTLGCPETISVMGTVFITSFIVTHDYLGLYVNKKVAVSLREIL